MKRLLTIFALQIAFGTWLAAPVFADNLRDPSFMSKAQPGFAQIFNLDYEEAINTFSQLGAEYPLHPAPPFYKAVVLWLRELFDRDDLDLNRFVAPSYFGQPAKRTMDPETRRRFMEFIEQSRMLAEAALARNPADNDAEYFVASTYGILAAFAITVDHSKRLAFEYGKQSYALHSQLVSRDPHYYDSYMTLGMYEYIAGNLPWYIKWLSWIAGYSGTTERGFEYLNLAAARGLFVADEARVMLMVLYVRQAQFANALSTEQYLQAKYKRSFILPLARAQILEKMGDSDLAAAEYQNILAKAKAGMPNYNQLQLTKVRYVFGRKFMDLGRADLALPQFIASVNDGETPPRERVLSHLGAGEAFDSLGRRTEAIAQYREVLHFTDVEGSHRQAKEHLEYPFGH